MAHAGLKLDDMPNIIVNFVKDLHAWIVIVTTPTFWL